MRAQVVRVKSAGQIVEEMRPLPQSLDETTEAIKHEMYDAASHFVYIGYLLWRVREQQAYCRNGASYADVYEYAADQLGFKRTTVKNLIGISETFGNYYYHSFSCSILPTPELKPDYQEFNYSQLTEMLSMSEKQRSMVTPDMSVRQIREIKKGSAPASEPEFPLDPQHETIPMELPGSVVEPAAGQTSDEQLITLELDEDSVRLLTHLLREEMAVCGAEFEPDCRRADRVLREFQRQGIFY